MCFNLACILLVIPWSSGLAATPQIAIIGSGIGGTSCAYFLRQLFGDYLSITMYEKDVVGGRLTTIAVANEEYEAGGSIIHRKNKYMSQFAELLGLERRKSHPGIWGIYDGEEFLVQESPWTAVTVARLYWRYGWSIFKLDSMLKALLRDFSKIYDAQDKGRAFTSVTNLLDYMNANFPNMTQQTLASYLKVEGFSEPFIKELAQAGMLVNYGQTTDVNAFVGAVSLAGMESGLWNIKGGNKKVPIGLLEKSKIKLIEAEVISVLLLIDGSYELTYKMRSSNVIVVEKVDVVILAAPLMYNVENIKFLNFTKDMTKYEGVYHRTVSTFIKGQVNGAMFKTNHIPNIILTNNDSFLFNCMGESFPVTDKDIPGSHKVYKVFSKVPLTTSQIKELFGDVSGMNSKDWLAYPHYKVPEKIPSFMLYPNLYYLNAIEWAASAMEMSAIAGRNIALLVYNTWNDKTHLVDSLNEVHKDEL